MTTNPLEKFVKSRPTGYTSISVSVETHQDLQEIADDLRITLGKTVEALVEYYKSETTKAPADY